MIRLATVGTSAITEKFLAAVKASGRYCLQVAYSRDIDKAKAFAQKHGFRGFCDSLSALAKDKTVDAVYIATPNVFHTQQSRLFLQESKHVLCEKPIVTESREFSALVDLAEENNAVYMEAIMSRHTEGRSVLQKALGEIGKISLARLNYCQLSKQYDLFLAGKQVNIFDMSLAAGTLMDLGVYCVWSAVDLFGEPDKIFATASFAESGTDMSGSAVFCYKNFPVILSYAKSGQSAVGSEIIGDTGTIRIGSVSQYFDITLIKNGCETPLFGFPDRTAVMSGETTTFADFIECPDQTATAYHKVTAQTLLVHQCMDTIKAKAGIQYLTKEKSV